MDGRATRIAAALLVVAAACSDDSTAPGQVPTPTSVVVSTSSLTFSSLGETAQLTATVHDQNGQAMASATVAWVSADTDVATVDGNGLVSAAGQGATNIVVTAGSTASASVGVTVEQVPHTVVLSAPLDSLAVGDSIQMTAEALDGLGNPIADVAFEWSSSDTTIATVTREGWVDARSAGSVEITVRVGDLSAFRFLVIYRDQDASDERAALEAFYHATNGPNWNNQTNWLSDKPLGQWYGVETDDGGNVVGLNFNKNGLRGRLPAELT
ncbi:MAG: hypothetical protein F4237_08550, partial [Gemmatimonadetes bacterium]|nr:hypothetical protein [Gemmatimonadota bacterium]